MDEARLTGLLIEREIVVDASAERVFAAFTEKAELERWFVYEASIDLRSGGWMKLLWGQAGMAQGRIVTVIPARRFVFEWQHLSLRGATTVEVDLLPAADGAGTRVRVRHSGHGAGEEWEQLRSLHNQMWDDELRGLRRWIEEGVAPIRSRQPPGV